MRCILRWREWFLAVASISFTWSNRPLLKWWSNINFVFSVNFLLLFPMATTSHIYYFHVLFYWLNIFLLTEFVASNTFTKNIDSIFSGWTIFCNLLFQHFKVFIKSFFIQRYSSTLLDMWGVFLLHVSPLTSLTSSYLRAFCCPVVPFRSVRDLSLSFPLGSPVPPRAISRARDLSRGDEWATAAATHAEVVVGPLARCCSGPSPATSTRQVRLPSFRPLPCAIYVRIWYNHKRSTHVSLCLLILILFLGNVYIYVLYCIRPWQHLIVSAGL